MTRKLTPMREFTLEMYEQLDCVHKFQDVVYKYAKFLGQKPTLGMFVGENAIFEGFEVDIVTERYTSVKNKNRFGIIFTKTCVAIPSKNIYTLEDLTNYDLTVKFEI